MKDNTYLIIMAGGTGTRFWPMSKTEKPKQFLDILGTGESLLQMTYSRFLEIIDADKIFVITNEAYSDWIKEQIPSLPDKNILLEPYRRNTAACIAYGSYKIHQLDPDANIVATPADHAIFNERKFFETIKVALNSTDDKRLITLGIKATRPETGYGYIQYLQNTLEPVKKVKTFTEKPEISLAEKFIESGDFVWNAGIFIWSSKAIINAFKQYDPIYNDAFEDFGQAYNTERENNFVKKAYAQSKGISIDYSILEKSPDVYMVLGDFGWSDLGSWNSVYQLKGKDNQGQVIEGNVMSFHSKNNMVVGSKEKLIVLYGIEDHLIADCDNTLLVCPRNLESEFRDILKSVKNEKGDKYL
ncbi:MAG: mannose-1-phosphate guanylyltransferase [Cyclobacteriaceae bacterium]|nr:mannose-1-phosphate guanylyltransferase [Cyclobacteriaceae bacterium]MCH8517542.1 mannose-1-phosphate guanylyltransferase [Cyclobacteriaceae bacterium]